MNETNERQIKTLGTTKHIALIAHDARKPDMIAWCEKNAAVLKRHMLFGTGTTARLIAEKTGLEVKGFKSGPLGGDQQIGCKIVEGEIDFMIFLWDPMSMHPHDPDVKALLRIATLYNIPIATNQSTADFILNSQYMDEPYQRQILNFDGYLKREL